jgi:hypothetical protein
MPHSLGNFVPTNTVFLGVIFMKSPLVCCFYVGFIIGLCLLMGTTEAHAAPTARSAPSAGAKCSPLKTVEGTTFQILDRRLCKADTPCDLLSVAVQVDTKFDIPAPEKCLYDGDVMLDRDCKTIDLSKCQVVYTCCTQ